MDIQVNVSDAMKKVHTLETLEASLNSKIDEKVFGLDSKLEAILSSLSEAKNRFPPLLKEKVSIIN